MPRAPLENSSHAREPFCVWGRFRSTSTGVSPSRDDCLRRLFPVSLIFGELSRTPHNNKEGACATRNTPGITSPTAHYPLFRSADHQTSQQQHHHQLTAAAPQSEQQSPRYSSHQQAHHLHHQHSVLDAAWSTAKTHAYQPSPSSSGQPAHPASAHAMHQPSPHHQHPHP